MFRPGPPRDRLDLPERFSLLEVEVDLAAARALRAGEPLPLEPKAFDLLLLLAANPGRVVEKQEIFERIWPDAVVTDNALSRVVAHLRRELGDDAEAPRFVETVRTRGYRAIAEPRPGAPEAQGDEGPPDRGTPSQRSGRDTHGVRWALAATALALAAVLAWLLAPREAGEKATTWVASPELRTFERGYNGGGDFSPDGSQIVYSSDAAGGLELFVRPLEGGRRDRSPAAAARRSTPPGPPTAGRSPIGTPPPAVSGWSRRPEARHGSWPTSARNPPGSPTAGPSSSRNREARRSGGSDGRRPTSRRSGL